MRDLPTMGMVIIEEYGIVRKQRAHIYFGCDADYVLRVTREFS